MSSQDVTNEPANTQSQVVDDNDTQAPYHDDGMGSPVRQFVPRGRARKTKADSTDAPKRAPKTKAASKTASKVPAIKETMPKKRKAAAATEADEEPTSSVKVSKRAKTMAAEGAAKASAKSSAKVPKGAQKDAYDRVQDALAQLEEHEALLTSFAEEDIEGFLERTRSDDGFEVEEIDDDDFPTSPAPAPERRPPTRRKSLAPTTSSSSSSQSGRGLPAVAAAPPAAPVATAPHKALPQYAAVAPWGPWAIAPRDRAGDGKNETLVEVERKLKDYYLVPFAVWWAAPKGTHTKYSAEKHYDTKKQDVNINYEDRKVVHAVLEGYAPGEKAGRMCNGWKSEKAPWPRVEYKTVDFYLQKKDLPADWTPPGIEQLRSL